MLIYNNVMVLNDPNLINGNPPQGIAVAANSAQGLYCVNVVVANNLADGYGPTHLAFSIRNPVTESDPTCFQNCSGVNNVNVNGTATDWGVDVTNSNNVQITAGNAPNTFVSYVPLLANNDYHLKSTDTVLRGQGINFSSYFTTDKDGNTRPTTGAWDIGPYAYIVGSGSTNRPTVSLTSPAVGAVISNSITLSATASDYTGGSGVASVIFLVDGAAVGTDTASPYSITWNSATVTSGSHAIQAQAQDVAGYQATSTAVTVTVANPPPPPQNFRKIAP
jgi:hypothetical protein